MRAFVALVDKEWRDARAVVTGFALLVPAAIYGTEAAFTHWRHPEVSAPLAGCIIVLFAAVLCADLVAAERTSGRAGSFALLPTGGATHWLAKVAFATAATLLFAACVALSALVLHTLFGGIHHVALLSDRAEREAPWLALTTVGVGGSALLFSTLLPRGLPAAILALVVGIAVVPAARSIDTVPYEFHRLDMTQAFTASALLGVLLALGSLVGGE